MSLVFHGVNGEETLKLHSALLTIVRASEIVRNKHTVTQIHCAAIDTFSKNVLQTGVLLHEWYM